MVSANVANRVELVGGIDAGNFGTEELGQLDRECTNPAASAVDQDCVTRVDLLDPPKRLKREHAGLWHAGCLLERQVPGLTLDSGLIRCRQTRRSRPTCPKDHRTLHHPAETA